MTSFSGDVKEGVFKNHDKPEELSINMYPGQIKENDLTGRNEYNFLEHVEEKSINKNIQNYFNTRTLNFKSKYKFVNSERFARELRKKCALFRGIPTKFSREDM